MFGGEVARRAQVRSNDLAGLPVVSTVILGYDVGGELLVGKTDYDAEASGAVLALAVLVGVLFWLGPADWIAHSLATESARESILAFAGRQGISPQGLYFLLVGVVSFAGLGLRILLINNQARHVPSGTVMVVVIILAVVALGQALFGDNFWRHVL
jgi:peptidoglycan/LPS O-acetylase OafA/YrhL